MIFFGVWYFQKENAKKDVSECEKAARIIENRAKELAVKGEDAAAGYLKSYALDLKNLPENSREETCKKLTSAANFPENLLEFKKK